MHYTQKFDIALVATLTTIVVGGLISAGMASALVAGTVIGGTYMLLK